MFCLCLELLTQNSFEILINSTAQRIGKGTTKYCMCDDRMISLANKANLTQVNYIKSAFCRNV